MAGNSDTRYIGYGLLLGCGCGRGRERDSHHDDDMTWNSINLGTRSSTFWLDRRFFISPPPRWLNVSRNASSSCSIALLCGRHESSTLSIELYPWTKIGSNCCWTSYNTGPFGTDDRSGVSSRARSMVKWRTAFSGPSAGRSLSSLICVSHCPIRSFFDS
jgi:hypothetical protein